MIANPSPLQHTHAMEPNINMDNSYSGELVKEFQKTRQKLQEALALRDKEREEMHRQLYGGENNKFMEEWWVNIIEIKLYLLLFTWSYIVVGSHILNRTVYASFVISM